MLCETDVGIEGGGVGGGGVGGGSAEGFLCGKLMLA